MRCFGLNKLFLFLFLLFVFQAGAQRYGLVEQSFGHLKGYVLFAPLETRETYLINKCGEVVHQWHSHYKPGQSAYILANGDLLRTANDSNMAFVSGGGRIEWYDWNNDLKWSFVLSDSLKCLHHDIFPMPNGNILALLWEKKSRAEAVAQGRNPELLGKYIWNEKIIEIKPKGKSGAEIVWYWDVWENLVQDFDAALPNYGKIIEHPDKINLNFAASKNEDWLHFNALSYNAKNEEVLISNRNFSEFFIVKHSTKSKSPATENTGILYRWGNAIAYIPNTPIQPKLFSQHSPVWISDGKTHAQHIMVFNNGNTRPGKLYSSVDIVLPKKKEDNTYLMEPDLQPVWRYCDTTEQFFYSKNVSNAQMLDKGHVFICQGASGRFFELDEKKNIVWQYVNPMYAKGTLKQGEINETNRVFRAMFYDAKYKGLKHKKLKAIRRLEADPQIVNCIPGSE